MISRSAPANSPPVTPDLFDPGGDEAAGDPVELFEREQFLAWQKRHRLGHAVSASQIATIGYREPEVLHTPAKPINKCNRHRSLPIPPLSRSRHQAAPRNQASAAASMSGTDTNFSRGLPQSAPLRFSAVSMAAQSPKLRRRATRVLSRASSAPGSPSSNALPRPRRQICKDGLGGGHAAAAVGADGAARPRLLHPRRA